MVILFKKIGLAVKSIWFWTILKMRYGSRIRISLINSLKGKTRIELQPESVCTIGKFLMTAGVCNIKCTKGAELWIGSRCFMNHNCAITCTEKIVIGDDCCIANNVVIVDHDHVVKAEGVEKETESEPIFIGNRVWIGANVVITRGVSIGTGSVVAAGAVVISDIPEHEIWGGVPAKCLKKIKES